MRPNVYSRLERESCQQAFWRIPLLSIPKVDPFPVNTVQTD